MLKMYVSDLYSAFYWFFSNLRKTSKKGGRTQGHVRFITHHGAALPNVDSIRIVFQLRFIVLGVITKFEQNLQKMVDGILKTAENGA